MFKRLRKFYFAPKETKMSDDFIRREFTRIWINNWSSLEILNLTNEIRKSQRRRRGDGPR